MRLTDKFAIVTGGANGIGFGIATSLAREGASVCIVDNAATGETAAQQLRGNGGRAMFVKANVRDEGQVAAAVQSVLSEFGRIDILVNNVGIYPRATLEGTTSELWDMVMEVNVRSAFYFCKHCVPHMKVRGGSVISLTSIHATQGSANLVAYATSKAALSALSKTLAGVYARDRIRFNEVVPGWVITDNEIATHAAEGRSEAELRALASRVPLGRHQTPEDLGNAVVFLASDDASQITAAELNVDAGVSKFIIR